MASPHDILSAYSRGEISAMEAIDRLGLDDLWDLRIAMADAGHELPKPPPDEVRRQVDAALPLLRAALIPEEEYLLRLRAEVLVGVDDVRAGRFATRTVDEIAADVERESGYEDIVRLRRAVQVGIDDWQAGRVDDRQIEEILDEIEGEDGR
mgnify:CR=1 FL=1